MKKALLQYSQLKSRSRPATSSPVVFSSLALGAIFVDSVLPTLMCRSAPTRLASAMPCALPALHSPAVSYTHLTLPTNREV